MTVVTEAPTEEALHVIDGIGLSEGHANVTDDIIVANINHAIRLGHPQVWGQPVNADRVVLVGGGPSLAKTLPELRELYFEGAKVVTVNGAYSWCIERNIRPSCQILVDARSSNARFVDPEVPQCRYYLASQCHPDTWARVAGREHVAIFHSLGPDGEDTDAKLALEHYYLGNWQGIAGGTTVTSRAIGLLRALGFLRFDLFGVDSCYLDGQHHAYDQPENARDTRVTVEAAPSGHDDMARRFECAPWHLKQLEDFLRFIKFNGDKFLLNVHGDGLLAHALQTNAAVSVLEES